MSLIAKYLNITSVWFKDDTYFVKSNGVIKHRFKKRTSAMKKFVWMVEKSLSNGGI